MVDELDLGRRHRIIFAEYAGEPRVGGNVQHPPVDGKCSGNGWISFEGRAWARAFAGNADFQSWKVENDDPLTLSPSILCRACGDHGRIRSGKWEPA